MTTNRGDRAPMTHRACYHDNTKAARAKCRAAVYAIRADIAAARKARPHIDACDDCGAQHEAELAHKGYHGEGQLYAVVCGEFIEYYQASRVIFP